MSAPNGEITRCQEAIGYLFRREGLLRKALTHSSMKDDKHPSNERLEFLGDAILGMVISEYLFSLLPENDEGDLTKVKSVVVSGESLARLGFELGLDKCLLIGKGLRMKKELPRSLIANMVEAIIAAVYLDRGMEAARHFILDHLHRYVHEVLTDDHDEKNYKSILQQFAQKEYGATPVYRVLGERGPDHHKSFRVAAVVDGREYSPGKGATKKEAEQDAARITVEIMKKDLSRSSRGGRRSSRRGGSRRRSASSEETAPESREPRRRSSGRSQPPAESSDAEPRRRTRRRSKKPAAPAETRSATRSSEAESESRPSRRRSAASAEGTPTRKKASTSGESRPARRKKTSSGEGSPARKKTSSGESRPARKKKTSSGEARPARKKATSTGESRPARKKATSTGESRPARKKATSTGESRPARKKKTSSGEGRPARKKATSSGEDRPARRKKPPSGERRPARKKKPAPAEKPDSTESSGRTRRPRRRRTRAPDSGDRS